MVPSAAALQALATWADAADAEPAWPAASWEALRHAGVLRWAVPQEHGGAGLPLVQMLGGYELLAGACLTTTFLLSQRDAAIRRLRELGRPERVGPLLSAQARGDAFATVGLSQLTTSHQHTAPAMTATPVGLGGFVLDGVMPWVSGAGHADLFVTGAALPDGRQVLIALPRQRAGVTVEPALDLCALRGSETGPVSCRGVAVSADEVLAGPGERLLSGGRGAGGLEPSSLALGLAGAAVEFLQREAAARADLRPFAERFEAIRQSVRGRLHALAAATPDAAALTGLRVRVTRLALGATQAALTAAKGAGFVRPHPAQRWARQALFFLVWSCPRPAAEGILARLVPEDGPGM
jgi:alkylation response protein AidB-like acyl-CoA dehydrogenase